MFFRNELPALAISTTLSLIGYKWGGLTGLGVAFAAGYALYFLQVFLLAKYLYQYRLSPNYLWIFLIQSALLLATFAALIVQWEAAY